MKMKHLNLVKIESLDAKCQMYFELEPIKTFTPKQPVRDRYQFTDLDLVDLRVFLFESYKVKIAIHKLFKCTTSYP